MASLAFRLSGFIPSPHGLDELLVLGVLGVELGELVRLNIGSDIESGESLLATDEESTTDERVVGATVDGSSTEDVLAGALKTGEEATDLVVAHEGEGKLVVVLVVHSPEGVLLEVDVLPEPGKGNLAGLLVGVLALEVVNLEGGAAEGLDGVLGLGGLGSLILIVVLGGSSLGLGGLLGLLSLGGGLLLGGLVGDGLLDELELLGNVRVDGLVGDSLEPTGDVGVVAAPLLVEEVLEAAGDDAGSEDVGKSEALTNEVGVDEEVVLKGTDSLGGGLLGGVDGLLVVGVTADQRAEPATEGGEDLSVGKGHPSEDGGVVLLGLAEESGLLVLGGDYGNGNALGEDVAVGTLEGGDLAELVELEVLGLDTLGRLGVNDVKVEAVGLCDGQQGGEGMDEDVKNKSGGVEFGTAAAAIVQRPATATYSRRSLRSTIMELGALRSGLRAAIASFRQPATRRFPVSQPQFRRLASTTTDQPLGDIRAAPPIDFSNKRDAAAEETAEDDDMEGGRSIAAYAAMMDRLRIIPASPSYFTGKPDFTDDLLNLENLLRKYQTLPVLPTGHAPRIAWKTLAQYKMGSNEPVKAARYTKILQVLQRLNYIHPNLMPDEVAYALRRYMRDVQPFHNQPKPGVVDEYGRARGVGRRKSSNAVAYLVEGEGECLINGKPLTQAFGRLHDRESALWALKVTERVDKYNVWCVARGGGTTGQADAIALAVSKALMVHEPLLKPALRRAGVVTRDPRRVERKKPGKLKARKMPAWVKR
ncbi:hypothetical protein D6C84_07549 [Aureobasidium pullulans]|uniref:Small ribosomal subunit protein uS9m n=1 Tax=Aureobasidium pullulans TaxID=5580 RepID=A0A4S9XQR2_AURPU|nr:hypothetical protein D6C84_07549 [Aureobasidium pullulans]